MAAPYVLTWFIFLPAAIPDSQVRHGILEGKLSNEDIRNAIPEPVATPPPKIRQQPFDYDGEVYIGSPTEKQEEKQEQFPEEDEETEEEDNQLNPRGDVFSKCLFIWLSCNKSALGGPQSMNSVCFFRGFALVST